MSAKLKPNRATIKPCKCRYQKEHPWGYYLWSWIGGRASWKALWIAPNIEEALTHAEQFQAVLIKCNGCGAEMLREYPANWNKRTEPKETK